MAVLSARGYDSEAYEGLLRPYSPQTAWLDGKHVVFGNVTKGIEVVDAIERVGTPSGRTVADVTIVDSGVVA